MPPTKPKSFASRKLLVAAIGVATINYVGVAACGGATDGSEPDGGQYNRPPTSGNLPAPDVRPDAQPEPPPTSGNLPAPPPPDASEDVDSSVGDVDAGEPSDAAADADSAVR